MECVIKDSRTCWFGLPAQQFINLKKQVWIDHGVLKRIDREIDGDLYIFLIP